MLRLGWRAMLDARVSHMMGMGMGRLNSLAGAMSNHVVRAMHEIRGRFSTAELH